MNHSKQIYSIFLFTLIYWLTPQEAYSDRGHFRMMTPTEVKKNLDSTRFLVRPHTPEELIRLRLEQERASSTRNAKKPNIALTELPSSVDLSKTPYFPGIGDQGTLGSCVGWSGGYYVFTYELLKSMSLTSSSLKKPILDRGLSDDSVKREFIENSDIKTDLACSVPYLQSFTTGGKDREIEINKLNYLLTTLGCPSIRRIGPWDNINEYGNLKSNFYPSLLSQIEGTSRRISGIRYFTSVSDPFSKTDPALYSYSNRDVVQEIKQVLQAGFMVGGLNIAIYTDFYSRNFGKTACDQDGVYIFGRCFGSPSPDEDAIREAVESFDGVGTYHPSLRFEGAHALTLVGYDDDKTYTVGNKIKRGAFRVVNSWGKAFGPTSDPGFFWIPYDEFKKSKSVFENVNPALEWRKGSKLLGFPDEEHSVISGTLYYITGIKNSHPKNILQVNLFVPAQEQDGVSFNVEVSTNSTGTGSNSKSKVFGNWSKDWFTQGTIQDGEDLNVYFQNATLNQQHSGSGYRVKTNQKHLFVQDISDLLEEVNDPTFLSISPNIPVTFHYNEQTYSFNYRNFSQILSATLYHRTDRGYRAVPIELIKKDENGIVFKVINRINLLN